MKVDAPTFIVKTISECSEIAGEGNTLAVTLVPNVPLPKGTVVSIVGLVGARVAKGPAPVSGKDAPDFGNATWIEATSTLKLTVQSDSGFPAKHSISFDLAVGNPQSPQQPVQPSVGADHADVIIGVATMSGHVLSAKSSRKIVAASIAESSTVAGSYNTLMMMIQTNVVVPVGSSVTISGLSGTVPTGSPYELGGMHPFYFDTPSFNHNGGTLVLRVTSAIPANLHTMIAMEVKNGNDGREGVSCEVAVGCPADEQGRTGCLSLPTVDMIGKVLSFKSRAVFTTMFIGQSSPYPGDANVLSVTLATNVEFRAAAGNVAKITVSGLTNANVTAGSVGLGGSHPFDSAVWDGKDTLTIRIAADMRAGVPHVFTFEVRNPFTPQSLCGSSTPQANCAGPVFVASSELDIRKEDGKMVHESLRILGLPIFDAQPGEGSPMFVRAARFLVAKIEQSSPYPCSPNVICVSLKPSVPLTAETKTRITISPLTKATSASGTGELRIYKTVDSAKSDDFSVDANKLEIFKSPVSGTLSTGHWNQDAASLEVAVACKIAAGEGIKMCFTLTNPAEEQLDPPPVNVKLSSQATSQVLEQPLPFTNPAGVFEWPDDAGRTSAAMFVRRPAFAVGSLRPSAGQSTGSACAENTITVTLSTNVPLVKECNVRLTVLGLNGTQTASGVLAISNLTAQHVFESTGNFSGSGGACMGCLVLELRAASTQAGQVVKFSFKVQNGKIGHRSSGVELEVSGIRIAKTALVDQLSDAQGSALATFRYGHPVNVRDPEFTTKSVSGDNTWPGGTNTITISFTSSIDLKGSEQAAITVSGLAGSSWDAPLTVSVQSAKASFACGSALSDMGSFVMYSHADVRGRFADQVDDAGAPHFLCVRKFSASWKYYDEAVQWRVFNPVPTDILVATVTAVNVTSLQSTDPDHDLGIAKGYKGGDVRFQWDSTAPLKISFTGDFLIPHGVALTDAPGSSTHIASWFGNGTVHGRGVPIASGLVLTIRDGMTLLSGTS